jgi:hypothetical protein
MPTVSLLPSEKMPSSGVVPTLDIQPAGFALSTKAITSKRAKIAKATTRLINRFLPDHKIVIFTK